MLGGIASMKDTPILVGSGRKDATFVGSTSTAGPGRWLDSASCLRLALKGNRLVLVPVLALVHVLVLSLKAYYQTWNKSRTLRTASV